MTNEAWQDDEDEWLDDDEEAPPPPNRRWPILAALAVAVIFAGSAWYALWNAGGVSDQAGAPLIHADTSPVKQKPTDPGGLQIPYQEKLVYERLQPPPAGPTLDKPPQVAPKPEQPVERPQPEPQPAPAAVPPAASTTTAQASQDTSTPKMAEATPTPQPAVTSTTSAPPATGNAPEKAAAEPAASGAAASSSSPSDTAGATTSDATKSTANATPTETAANTTSEPSTMPPKPAVKPAPEPQPVQPSGKTNSNTLNDVARVLAGRETLPATPAKPAPSTSAAPKPAATAAPKAPAQATASLENAYRIQVAASRDEAGARTAWSLIQSRHTDVLGRLQLHISRVNIVGKGVFYRVQAGPFPGAEDAQAACQKLRAGKQDCLIVRP